MLCFFWAEVNYNKDNDTDKQQLPEWAKQWYFGLFFFFNIELYELFKILDINPVLFISFANYLPFSISSFCQMFLSLCECF